MDNESPSQESDKYSIRGANDIIWVFLFFGKPFWMLFFLVVEVVLYVISSVIGD